MNPRDDAARRPWYEAAFGPDYLARYAHRDAGEARRQVGFVAARGLLPPGRRVLDLATGGGRHLAEIRAHGRRGVGLDLSAGLLAAARERLRDAPLVRGDMRALPFRDAAFACVLQMFTSFGYFEDDAEHRRVLAEVARVLAAGGAHVLDLMNPARAVATLEASSRRRLPGPGGDVVVEEHRRHDARLRRIVKQVRVAYPDGRVSELEESVRLIEPQELVAWLEAAGFASVELFGGFDGTPFDPAGSERLVAISRRAGAGSLKPHGPELP